MQNAFQNLWVRPFEISKYQTFLIAFRHCLKDPWSFCLFFSMPCSRLEILESIWEVTWSNGFVSSFVQLCKSCVMRLLAKQNNKLWIELKWLSVSCSEIASVQESGLIWGFELVFLFVTRVYVSCRWLNCGSIPLYQKWVSWTKCCMTGLVFWYFPCCSVWLTHRLIYSSKLNPQLPVCK